MYFCQIFNIATHFVQVSIYATTFSDFYHSACNGPCFTSQISRVDNCRIAQTAHFCCFDDTLLCMYEPSNSLSFDLLDMKYRQINKPTYYWRLRILWSNKIPFQMINNSLTLNSFVISKCQDCMYWIFSAPGGDFQSVLDNDMVPFEEDVQGFLRQILEALDFIHERNIAHLDIKVIGH